MRSRISGATLTVAFLVAGLAMPTSALARGWAVTPPAPLPANTNLVVCADGGSGPVVADGPNFRTATLTAGQCIPWSVHEGQYNVGLQYSPDPSAPTLSYIKVFRPGGQGATLAPPTVATNVAPFPDDPSIGPTDANGIPTGDTSGSDPINVTVVVLHFGPGPGGGGGAGGGGAGGGGAGAGDGAGDGGSGGGGASAAGHHACGALTAHPTCPAA